MRKLATFLTAKGGASKGICKLCKTLLGGGFGILLVFALAGPAAAQTVDIRTVVLTGDPAPGTTGAIFNDFSSIGRAPAINNSGNTAFAAIITGGDTTGGNQVGIWKENPDLTLVARKGTRPVRSVHRSVTAAALA